MKIEIEVETAITEKKTIEVEFPLYFQSGNCLDGGGWYEVYHRIDEGGVEHEIHCNDRGQWEYEASKVNLSTALGERLFRQSHYYRSSDAEEFAERLAEFRALLADVASEYGQIKPCPTGTS